MVYFVIGLIIGLLVLFFVAGEFQEIAEMKGHESRRYFWWTFLTGVPGMLMVIALPNLNVMVPAAGNARPQTYVPTPSTPAAPAARPAPAPAPAARIAPAPVGADRTPARKPIAQGTKKPVTPVLLDDGREKCPYCLCIQRAGRSLCMDCGSPFVRKPVPGEKSLKELLSYALQFSSDDGMVYYLKRGRESLTEAEREDLDELLFGPAETLRARAQALIKE